MAQSSEVAAGDDILATQYNNLRKDVLDAILGHEHLGGTDEGNKIPLAGLEQEVLDKLTPKSIQQGSITVSIVKPSSSGDFSNSNTAAITSVDTSKAYVIFLGFTTTGPQSLIAGYDMKGRIDLTNGTTVTARMALSTNDANARTIVGTFNFVVVEWN